MKSSTVRRVYVCEFVCVCVCVCIYIYICIYIPSGTNSVSQKIILFAFVWDAE